MEAAYQKLTQLAAPVFQGYAGLPFPVYVVSTEGMFLLYNQAARTFFHLPEAPSFRDSIIDYYIHAADRQEYLHRLRQQPSGQWLKEVVIDLKIYGEVKHVRDFTLAIRDEAGAIAALLCLMINISEGGRYHRLFNGLPVGIFSFRNGRGLVNANPKFLAMYGFESLEEAIGKMPEEFVRNPAEFKELQRRLLDEGGSLANHYQEHVRRDGTPFTAAVTVRAIAGSEGRYIGFEGIVEDVSAEAIYFELANDVPIGLYKIKFGSQGEHALVHCNEHFARSRGAAAPAALHGQDMRKFMPPACIDSQDVQQRLAQAVQQGDLLTDYEHEAYDGQGALRKYEVHAKALLGIDGQIVGLLGAERDLTDYLEAQQDLKELTIDIGNVLHSYTTTLLHTRQAMDAVIRALSPPSAPSASVDEQAVWKNILQALDPLLQGMIKALENPLAAAELKLEEATRVQRIIALLQAPQGTVFIQQLVLVRDGVIDLRKALAQMEQGNMPRELSKHLKRQAEEVLRLCSLITLNRGVDNVLEMDTKVTNLRSFVLRRVREKEKMQRVDIYELLLGVARNLEEFAASRGVELRFNLKEIRNAYIDAYEAELSRALLNIVHNAVKYSWSRRSSASVFVSIEGKKDQDWLYLNVENWGVPITEEELLKGLIFKVGYRGVNSRDRHRPGTGLGLYDALRVIEKHRGSLRIASEPSLGNARDDYSNPFITTVNIQLPLNHYELP